MAFDRRRFLATEFQPRTERVPVPGLARWFGDDEPVWEVRGLTGRELARVNAAAEAARSLEALAEALTAQTARDKAQALRDLLGLGDDTPEDLARRVEMLRMGSVDPPCDRELAVRLADAYPVELYQLTNAIIRLTGKGKRPGESSGSGASPASEPPSP